RIARVNKMVDRHIGKHRQQLRRMPSPPSAGSSLRSHVTCQRTNDLPSGRAVAYALDSAGRIGAINNVATGLPYASSFTYTPAGGISAMTLGNGITEQYTWNDRLQLTGITATKGTNQLALGLYPCTSLATSCSSG